MKKGFIITSLLLLIVLGSTTTIKAWSPVDDVVNGRYAVIFLNSPVIEGGKTYQLYINPEHTSFVLWNNELTGEPSYIKWVCATTVETNLIDLARDFGPPRARPNGYFVIPVPSNCDIANGTHYGVIYMMMDTILSEGVQANRLSFSTTFGDLEVGLLTPYFQANFSGSAATAYADGFARGLANATGTGVNAVTAFIPQILGVTFAFFFQILSFQVFGVSALTILGTLLALSIGILTFKLFFGR